MTLKSGCNQRAGFEPGFPRSRGGARGVGRPAFAEGIEGWTIETAWWKWMVVVFVTHLNNRYFSPFRHVEPIRILSSFPRTRESRWALVFNHTSIPASVESVNYFRLFLKDAFFFMRLPWPGAGPILTRPRIDGNSSTASETPIFSSAGVMSHAFLGGSHVRLACVTPFHNVPSNHPLEQGGNHD